MEQSHHDVGAMIQIGRRPMQAGGAGRVRRVPRTLADAQLLVDALGLRQILTSLAIPA